MKNRPPITHLLAITFALAGLAAGAWLYTNANDPVAGIPEAPAAEGQGVIYHAYFGNSKLDPEQTCEAVFPVERMLPKQDAIASVAVDALAAGPTEEEKAAGYFTSLAPDTRLIGLRNADADSATYIFSSELDAGVAGSCRVLAIRAQIEATLKDAIPWLKDIELEAEGKTPEETLQP